MTDHDHDAPETAPETPRQTAAAWAQAKRTPAWLLAAATAHARWPRGQELTEPAFDAAVAGAATARIG